VILVLAGVADSDDGSHKPGCGVGAPAAFEADLHWGIA
jgi:hypothetical protein